MHTADARTVLVRTVGRALARDVGAGGVGVEGELVELVAAGAVVDACI